MGVRIFKPPIKNRTITSGKGSHYKLSKGMLLVGRKKRIYQSLIKFDISSLPLFLTILNCTLHVHLAENFCPIIEKTVAVHQVLSPWYKGKNLRINTLPVASATISSVNYCFISFDITPLVIDWYTGNAVNSGVLLKLTDTLMPGLLGFNSKKSNNSAFWPFLEVSFLDPVPPGGESCCPTIDFDASVTTNDAVQTTATLNIQRFNYTYYIINTGKNSATVSTQISPDGTNWLPDSSLRVLAPGVMEAFIPSVIARFARITYQSTIHDQDTTLDIRVRGNI